MEACSWVKTEFSSALAERYVSSAQKYVWSVVDNGRPAACQRELPSDWFQLVPVHGFETNVPRTPDCHCPHDDNPRSGILRPAR